MNCEVRRIKREETRTFLYFIHYARRMPQITYAFGLFENKELIGVCTFGYPASPAVKKSMLKESTDDDIVLELNRLSIKPEYNGKNYGSYFVSRCLKMLPNKTYVVSYADSGWSHCGYIYQATNWLYTGKQEEMFMKWCNGKHARHQEKYNSEYKQLISAKYRYIYIIADKRSKKDMLKNIAWEIIKEYPKCIETKYDVNNPQPVDKRLNNPLDKDGNIVELNEDDGKLFDW